MFLLNKNFNNIKTPLRYLWLFEQTIVIRYIVYESKKIKINEINPLFSDRLKEFYLEKKKIAVFLKSDFPQSKCEELTSSINLKKSHYFIMSDEKIKSKINLRMQIHKSFCNYTSKLFPYEPVIFNEDYLFTDSCFNILYRQLDQKEFLDKILYFEPSRISKYNILISISI